MYIYVYIWRRRTKPGDATCILYPKLKENSRRIYAKYAIDSTLGLGLKIANFWYRFCFLIHPLEEMPTQSIFLA
jgi:hypothetical protein